MPETTHLYGITLKEKKKKNHHTKIALRKDTLNRRVVARGILKLIQHIAVKRLAIWILVCYNIEASWHFLPFIFIFSYHSLES